jgi:hypothetical protein
MNDLLRRQRALASTRLAFAGQAIDWVNVDCGRMLDFHLRAMGHEPPPMPKYRTAKGALRVLRKMGGIAGGLEALGLPRIAPLMMLPGDVGVLPGDDGMDAVHIWQGRKTMGWHEDSEVMANMIPDLAVMLAWRA